MIKYKLKKNGVLLGLAISLGIPFVSTNALAACNTCCGASKYAFAGSPAADNNTGQLTVSVVDRNTTVGCTGIKNVDEFTGSATSLIKKLKDDITKAGEVVRKQLEDNSMAEITTISDSTEAILKTMASINDSQTRDFINISRFFLDMEMNYMSELKEREVRAISAPLSLNDTQEVYKYILHNLDEEIKTGNKHSQPLIAAMSKKDQTSFGTIIPVQIKAAENPYSSTGESCESYDPTKHKVPDGCFYGVKDYPSDKLSKLFNECSREKRRLVSSVKKSSTADTVSRQVNQSQEDFMQVTGSLRNSAMVNKIKIQADISCSISDMENKYCHPSLTKKAYVEKVINLEIIPNGNISSSNLLSPTSIGSVDGRFDSALSEEDLKAMELTGLDRASKDGAGKNNAVSTNTVPIVSTYRSSSQYLAAKDFISNIMAKELVPNQDINNRTSTSAAVYQTRFLSRTAAMSLAESSMNKTIEARIGKKLREGIESGANFNPEMEVDGKKGVVIKEDINGAGYLDELADSIHKDYQKIVVNSTNGNSGIEEISVMSADALKEWQLSTVIRQNEMALMQYEQQERIELLLAAMLAQLTNSAAEISYLDDVRGE